VNRLSEARLEAGVCGYSFVSISSLKPEKHHILYGFHRDKKGTPDLEEEVVEQP
jgi:hypothetical protein